MDKGIGTYVHNGFVVVLAFLIVLGPAYRQVLRGKEEMMPRWAMFSGMAVNFLAVEVSYETVSSDLAPVSLDVLFPHRKPSKRSERKPVTAVRLRRTSDLDDLVRRACSKVGPDARVVVSARRAHRVKGWEAVREREPYDCGDLPKRRSHRRGRQGIE